MKPLLYLIPALLLAALVYSLVPQEQQLEFSFGADSGFVIAGTGENDASIGTVAWTTPENATADDGALTFAGISVSSCALNSVDNVFLVENGSIAGDNKTDNQAHATAKIYGPYGGASDTWGLSLTPAEVNASDFGFVVSLNGQNATSNYLKATNFGFSIPADATIDGIETQWDGTCSSAIPRIDYMAMKVYYTEAAPSAVAATGNLRTSSVQIRTGSVNFR